MVEIGSSDPFLSTSSIKTKTCIEEKTTINFQQTNLLVLTCILEFRDLCKLCALSVGEVCQCLPMVHLTVICRKSCRNEEKSHILALVRKFLKKLCIRSRLNGAVAELLA